MSNHSTPFKLNDCYDCLYNTYQLVNDCYDGNDTYVLLSYDYQLKV